MFKRTRLLFPYAQWLEAQGYQTSTIQATLRHLKTVGVGQHQGDCCVAHVQRYLRYVAETRKNPLGRDFLRLALKDGLEASDDRKRSGGRIKEMLSESDWTMLRAKLRRGDDISWMLIAYMQSPYRIGRFLKLDARKIDDSHIDDKRALDWIRERVAAVSGSGPVSLYKLLCKTERCAYYRMRRRLLDTCKKLGIEGDFDTVYKTHNERVQSRAVAAA